MNQIARIEPETFCPVTQTTGPCSLGCRWLLEEGCAVVVLAQSLTTKISITGKLDWSDARVTELHRYVEGGDHDEQA